MNVWLRAVLSGLFGLCLFACGSDDGGDGSGGSSGSSASGGTGALGSGGANGGGTGGAASDEPILCAPAVSSTPTECNSYQESVVLDQAVNAGDTVAVSIRVRSRDSLVMTVWGENATCGPIADATELGQHDFTANGEYCVEFPVDATYSSLRLEYAYRGETPLVNAICTGGCQ